MALINTRTGTNTKDLLGSSRRLIKPQTLGDGFGSRTGETPFNEKAKLIVHCSHHKAGTLWLARILRVVASVYGLPFKMCTQDEWSGDIGVFMQDHSEIEVARLPDFIGLHLIRDPRDMTVSAYFYHKWCDEPWVHQALPEYGNTSLQNYLNSLPEDEGIAVEIRRRNKRDIRGIKDWDYHNAKFFEIKYETLISHSEEIFGALFEHYGFHDDAISLALEVAEKLHFKNRTKREVGQERNMQHLRSGKSGQWRDYFTQAHKDLFKEIHGDLLVRLGYEPHNDW